ncbi:Soluble calcium-activated nucleotidase 1 [Aphelenchoides besseyi]|nr:Soluble calcium-activated nucleotidase 1 [Aphelenchoides besseyi]
MDDVPSTEKLTKTNSTPNLQKMPKRHSPVPRDEVLSRSWFVYFNLALVCGAFLVFYWSVPTKRECSLLVNYNESVLSTSKVLSNGDIKHSITVVTDLDHDSKLPEKNVWHSIMKKGALTVSSDGERASIEWDDEHDIILKSQIAAGGRAMELSDLAVFNGGLYSADDRTGLVYRIDNKNDIIPWVFVNDGPGNVTKGLKAEWLTVKDHLLYVGGLGKEWTTTTGEFVNYHPMYIKTISPTGEIRHVDWTENYKKLRSSVGIEYPGYMIHEAIQWSPVQQKWYVMPRRASKEIYDEAADEHRGTNLLLIADENFDHIEVHHVGEKGDGARGFSAFQFVPQTNDNVILALKSEEKDGRPVGLLLSCIVVLIGCVFLEGIRWYRAHRSNIRLSTATGPEEESNRKRLDAWLITDTALHAIQLVLAYLAMLVFMTFNVWLCIAVVVGEVGAHLIFRILWPHLDNMSNPVSFARPCCS